MIKKLLGLVFVLQTFLVINAHGATLNIGSATVFGAAPVPTPGTLFLLGIGLLGLAAVGRRKKIK